MECYELSIGRLLLRDDTPIYNEHPTNRPSVNFVLIQVNVEICKHVAHWYNSSNTVMGISNSF